MEPKDIAILQLNLLRLIANRTRVAFHERTFKADQLLLNNSPAYALRILLESVGEAVDAVKNDLEAKV